MTKLGNLVKDSSIYAVGSVLNRLGAFLLLPLYTNYLTAAEYGAMELFYSVAAVVSSILGVGLAHAALRFYFEYDKQSDRNAVISTCVVVTAIISALGLVTIFSIRETVVSLLFENDAYERVLVVLLVSTFFELSSQVYFAYIRAIEKPVLFVGITLVKLLLQIALNTLFLVFNEEGLEGAIKANASAVFLGWVMLFSYTTFRCGLSFHINKMREILSYSLPFLYSSIVGVVYANMDRFVINAMIGVEALGIYALALKMAQLIQALVGEPFSKAYGAYRFSIMKQADAGQVQNRALVLVLAIATFVGGGIVVFVAPVIELLSAPVFFQAAYFVPLLVLMYVLKIFVYTAQTGILVHKKTFEIFKISLTTLVVSFISHVVFGYLFDVWGICTAQLLTTLVAGMMTHRVSLRYFHVTYEFTQIGKLLAVFSFVVAANLLMPEWGLVTELLYKATIVLFSLVFLWRGSFIDEQAKQLIVGKISSISSRG